jgi:hypothetical protein
VIKDKKVDFEGNHVDNEGKNDQADYSSKPVPNICALHMGGHGKVNKNANKSAMVYQQLAF